MNQLRPKVVVEEPVPELSIEGDPRLPRGLPPLARVRVPLTLTVRPWATLYRLPDGRRIWCLRLRDGVAVRTRCVGSDRLLAYARASRLVSLERELREALAASEAVDGVRR